MQVLELPDAVAAFYLLSTARVATADANGSPEAPPLLCCAAHMLAAGTCAVCEQASACPVVILSEPNVDQHTTRVAAADDAGAAFDTSELSVSTLSTHCRACALRAMLDGTKMTPLHAAPATLRGARHLMLAPYMCGCPSALALRHVAAHVCAPLLTLLVNRHRENEAHLSASYLAPLLWLSRDTLTFVGIRETSQLGLLSEQAKVGDGGGAVEPVVADADVFLSPGRLQGLWLQGHKGVSAARIDSFLQRQPELTSLELPFCTASAHCSVGAVLRRVCDHRTLTTLSLNGWRGLREADFVAACRSPSADNGVAPRLPSLRVASLYGCIELGDRAAEALGDATGGALTHVNCSGWGGLTPAGVAALAQRAPALEDLRAIANEWQERAQQLDVAFHALAASCPRLKKLRLAHCDCLSDDALAQLLVNCAHLSVLHLGQAQAVTPAGFAAPLAAGLAAVESGAPSGPLHALALCHVQTRPEALGADTVGAMGALRGAWRLRLGDATRCLAVVKLSGYPNKWDPAMRALLHTGADVWLDVMGPPMKGDP